MIMNYIKNRKIQSIIKQDSLLKIDNKVCENAGILRDKTIPNTLMYIPIDYKNSYTF